MDKEFDKNIIQLLEEFDSLSGQLKQDFWQQNLKSIGMKSLLPFFIEFWPKAKKYQTRVQFVFSAIKFSRNDQFSFRLGILGLNDPSKIVRYRACQLLANSYKEEAIEELEKLLNHTDEETVQDARFAIIALKKKNHNYFIDRDLSNKTTWGRKLSKKEKERVFGKEYKKKSWFRKLFE